MNLQTFKQLAKLIRSDERYNVYDLDCGGLTLSVTELHPKQKTTGHVHKEADEIYYFLEGQGALEKGEALIGRYGEYAPAEVAVKKGDFYHIRAGDFHRVHNRTDKEMVFMCIFEKYER